MENVPNKQIDDSNLKPRGKKRGYFILIILLSLLFIGLVVVFFALNNKQNNEMQKPQEVKPAAIEETLKKVDILAIQGSVVLIACPIAGSKDSFSYGSGTIISEKGLILTNAHVIPNDGVYLNTLLAGCFVYLPDSETGLIDFNKAYVAEPKVIKDIGLKYDLATLQIYYNAGVDVTQKIRTLPNKFPSFDVNKGCPIKDVKLGDRLTIYGYPDTGESPSLTVTKGIVSKFNNDGYILTDAKINEGNSGGLVVNDDGCFIGIPEAGYVGKMESYGYIISLDLIKKFMSEAEKSKVSLKDESEKVRKIDKLKIETYFGDAPYFLSFKDEDTGGTKRSTGYNENFIILSFGNNISDLNGVSVISKVSLDDDTSIYRGFYPMPILLDLVDDRILINDKNFLIDMFKELIDSGFKKTIERKINGLTIDFAYADTQKALVLLITKAD